MTVEEIESNAQRTALSSLLGHQGVPRFEKELPCPLFLKYSSRG